MKNNCGNCFFCNERESLGSDVGECVVKPPTVVVLPNDKGKLEPAAFYPVVAHDQPECMYHRLTAKPTIGPADGEDVNPNLKD